jgi:hypothetical protein
LAHIKRKIRWLFGADEGRVRKIDWDLSRNDIWDDVSAGPEDKEEPAATPTSSGEPIGTLVETPEATTVSEEVIGASEETPEATTVSEEVIGTSAVTPEATTVSE